jgi:hypothetical protein
MDLFRGFFGNKPIDPHSVANQLRDPGDLSSLARQVSSDPKTYFGILSSLFHEGDGGVEPIGAPSHRHQDLSHSHATKDGKPRLHIAKLLENVVHLAASREDKAGIAVIKPLWRSHNKLIAGIARVASHSNNDEERAESLAFLVQLEKFLASVNRETSETTAAYHATFLGKYSALLSAERCFSRPAAANHLVASSRPKVKGDEWSREQDDRRHLRSEDDVEMKSLLGSLQQLQLVSATTVICDTVSLQITAKNAFVTLMELVQDPTDERCGRLEIQLLALNVAVRDVSKRGTSSDANLDQLQRDFGVFLDGLVLAEKDEREEEKEAQHRSSTAVTRWGEGRRGNNNLFSATTRAEWITCARRALRGELRLEHVPRCALNAHIDPSCSDNSLLCHFGGGPSSGSTRQTLAKGLMRANELFHFGVDELSKEPREAAAAAEDPHAAG